MTQSSQALVREQLFALETTADLFSLKEADGTESIAPDLAQAVLEEAGRLAMGDFAALNRSGDVEGARLTADGVKVPAGFHDAYSRYVEGEWGALGVPVQDGGQGLPYALACAIGEQFAGANLAFSLCMMLTSGAVEAIRCHGSSDLRASYLPKLLSGEWTGTMNLTEPQAGSDVGALRTQATQALDGSYRIKGSKIFITWGDHNIAANIVHLVLARLPDGPSGTKGISLFLVPKFLPDDDGNPVVRNDVRCTSIEHKLGIHASPTCTMSFGDRDECVGYLVGSEHGGMRAMFTMMNHARVNVGMQGVGVAEAAYQHALAYARERVQSGRFGRPGTSVAIVQHPDVRRMLMTMRTSTEAARAIALLNAVAIDRAHRDPDAGQAADAQGLADLLTPITKAFATDTGVEVASLGIQVFGGMGFIEETGAAQYYRDARIAPIYEGTNGIQALDLVGRKLNDGGGRHVDRLIGRLFEAAQAAEALPTLSRAAEQVRRSLDDLRSASTTIRDLFVADPDEGASVASPYLRMFGITLGAALLLEQAIAAERKLAGNPADGFLQQKIGSAQFYCTQILPQAVGLGLIVGAGAYATDVAA